MRKIVFWIVPIYLLICGQQYALAQATCPDLVLQAVQTVGASCAGMSRNSICYGNRRIDTVLTRPLGVEYFSEPSDQIQLVDVQSLHTAPLDLVQEEWGIAVMNLQANLPEVLPGQVVTLLVIGDAEVRNNSPHPNRALPALSTLAATSLYSQPDAGASILSALNAGALLSPIGITADGEWLRVGFGDLFGWLSRDAVDMTNESAEIPLVDAQTPLPMQAFTFRAAVGGPRCAEAPPSVLVMQGPEQVHVNLTVNGAQMQLGSTAVLWQPDGDHMQLAVLDGQVQLADGTTIPRGFTAGTETDEDGQVSSPWTAPRELTVFEIAMLLPLESFPAELLSYPINVPEEGEELPTVTLIPTPTRPATRAAPRATLTPTPLPPSPTPVPQVSFTADAQALNPGDCTTLRWASENIDSVYFEGQPTVGISEQQVCLRQTQTFVLLVYFRDGTQQTYTLTIQVNGPTSTPTATSTPYPVCGNQLCESGENALLCTVDCQPICGNAVCEPGENSCSCNSDCPGSCIG
jgi:hypothetical protein